MASERESSGQLAEFVKITKLGQSVAGRVKSFGVNDMGPFIVFEPVLLRDGKDARWQRYETVAVGMSADIAAKVKNPGDVGKYLELEFRDEEPTKFGNARKVFGVSELDLTEIREMAAGAEDRTGQRIPKPAPRSAGASQTALPF